MEKTNKGIKERGEVMICCGGYKSEIKLLEVISNNTVKCKCGHSISFLDKSEKKICNWCGNYVYKNKKLEFIEKLSFYLRKKELS